MYTYLCLISKVNFTLESQNFLKKTDYNGEYYFFYEKN